MNLRALSALFFFLSVITPANLRASADTQPSPFFHCELVNIAAKDSTQSRLLVFVTILNDDLTFVKVDSSYEASYEIAVAIMNKDGVFVDGRDERERIRVDRFADTNAEGLYHFHAHEFDLPPGKYAVTVTMTDRTSGSSTHRTAEKILRDFSLLSAPLEISDMMLLDRAVFDSAQGLLIHPGLYDNTTTANRELRLYLEIHDRLDQPLHVRQIIRDRQNKIILDQQRPWTRQGKMQRLVLPIWTDVLAYGAYEVEMQVGQGDARKTAVQKFRVTWNGIPETGLHLNQALTTATYIASDAEKKNLQAAVENLTMEEKRQILLDFWRARTSPVREEIEAAMTTYYHRVELANEKFGGPQEGWKTDMGRVFITYGMPDEIQIHTQNTSSVPKQIWSYHRLNRQFVFIDRNGLGDFMLAEGR